MLLFNTELNTSSAKRNIYFNTSYVTVQPVGRLTLKEQHPYFNTSYVTVQRSSASSRVNPPLNFNTSYVTVQQDYTNGCAVMDIISIHRMLLFNYDTIELLCGALSNFNTSYVTVQL